MLPLVANLRMNLGGLALGAFLFYDMPLEQCSTCAMMRTPLKPEALSRKVETLGCRD